MNEHTGKCPICGQDNGCAFNKGADPETCWCMTTKIPPGLRAAVREFGDGLSCICKNCLEQYLVGTHITKK